MPLTLMSQEQMRHQYRNLLERHDPTDAAINLAMWTENLMRMQAELEIDRVVAPFLGPIEPMKSEQLVEQRDALRQRATLVMIDADYFQLEMPLQLARFAEAVAIGNANRKIADLEKKIPKAVTAAPNDLLTKEDYWKIHFKLRSALYDYFLWRLERCTRGPDIAQLADEAGAAVQAIYDTYINKEK